MKLSEIKNLKQKTKLIIILAVEFIAIIAILALIFFAGKKTHTVTFDLNGGILLSGDVEQRVTQGQNAYPPSVAKYGHYLMGWSGSYKSVTRDVTVKAIWEYETSPGIEYFVPENTNYCEISGSFKEIQGEVFIGAFYEGRQVLGIHAGAFKDRTGITGVYLLDGILAIEDEAFSGCTSLEVVDIPSTVVRIGASAFKGCESLKEIILPESLTTIEEGAFEGCTSLEKITFNDKLITIGDAAFKGCKALNDAVLADGVKSIGEYSFYGCEALKEFIIPKSVLKIGKNAFNTTDITIKLYILEENIPEGFVDGWFTEGIKTEYGYIPEDDTPSDKDTDKNPNDKNGKQDKDGEDDDEGFWGGIL